MSYFAKESKQSLKVFITWSHTSFWLWALCNQPHPWGFRSPLQSSADHDISQKNKRKTGEQVPQAGKKPLLASKNEVWHPFCRLWPNRSHSTLSHGKKPFFPEYPQRQQWMKGSLYQEVAAESTHNLTAKKKKPNINIVFIFFFFFPFKAASEALLCWSAPLFALLKYLQHHLSYQD